MEGASFQSAFARAMNARAGIGESASNAGTGSRGASSAGSRKRPRKASRRSSGSQSRRFSEDTTRTQGPAQSSYKCKEQGSGAVTASRLSRLSQDARTGGSSREHTSRSLFRQSRSVVNTPRRTIRNTSASTLSKEDVVLIVGGSDGVKRSRSGSSMVGSSSLGAAKEEKAQGEDYIQLDPARSPERGCKLPTLATVVLLLVTEFCMWFASASGEPGSDAVWEIWAPSGVPRGLWSSSAGAIPMSRAMFWAVTVVLGIAVLPMLGAYLADAYVGRQRMTLLCVASQAISSVLLMLSSK